MRSSLQSPKYQQKRRRKIVAIIFLSVLCVVTLTATLVFLARLSAFQIKDIEVAGQNNLSATAIQQKALQVLLSTSTSASIIFFSKKNVEEGLKKEFKGIENVGINRTSLSSIRIDISERVPSALVCSGFHEENSENDDCSFSDSKGYIFERVPKPHPEGYNTYYVSGTSFVDEMRFAELQKFIYGAEQAGIDVSGILIGEDGEYEMYTSQDTTVYFDDRVPFDETLAHLLAFWRASSPPSPLNYINLRFGNTIYYSK